MKLHAKTATTGKKLVKTDLNAKDINLKKFPRIFKKTKAGNYQFWEAEVNMYGGKFRTRSGKVGGVETTSEWTQAETKNEGKANSTTPTAQAIKEVESRYRKALAQGGYRETMEEAVENKQTTFECMKCHKYAGSGTLTFPVLAQPKLDGMRIYIRKDGAFSYNHKRIHVIPHILKDLKEFFENHPDMVLDGEGYNHEFKHDFEEIISIFRSNKPTPENLERSLRLAQYHIYDGVNEGNTKLPFKTRQPMASQVCNVVKSPFIKKVPTVMCCNQEELDAQYEKWLEEGYEGQIIRTLNGVYKHGRSNEVLKRKEFTDEEYTILEVEEGVGKKAGRAAAMLFSKNGEEFRANVMGKFAVITEYWNKRKSLIGKQATVRYFRLTKRGVPFHGRVKTIRNYE